jgi:hypothetical protein
MPDAAKAHIKGSPLITGRRSPPTARYPMRRVVQPSGATSARHRRDIDIVVAVGDPLGRADETHVEATAAQVGGVGLAAMEQPGMKHYEFTAPHGERYGAVDIGLLETAAFDQLCVEILGVVLVESLV